jgi:predicted molibdopterin-dependent oxidoreductase YjgC
VDDLSLGRKHWQPTKYSPPHHLGSASGCQSRQSAQSDEVQLIQPGSDAALALFVMHVIVTERLYDPAFVEAHTAGFEELSAHVLPFTPAWAAEDSFVRHGMRLHATCHDPARRQLHAQGC